ncbi:unnamed protein product [Brachionus calyciflorus]|uniref:Uncharacterized protein n=1 Tax=Brachionus calyciflorus TaxID=104777 RepID=A0A813N907_9BILA|nr:unnamed protein product [Brachionus calyciflorus]
MELKLNIAFWLFFSKFIDCQYNDTTDLMIDSNTSYVTEITESEIFATTLLMDNTTNLTWVTNSNDYEDLISFYNLTTVTINSTNGFLNNETQNASTIIPEANKTTLLQNTTTTKVTTITTTTKSLSFSINQRKFHLFISPLWYLLLDCLKRNFIYF